MAFSWWPFSTKKNTKHTSKHHKKAHSNPAHDRKRGLFRPNHHNINEKHPHNIPRQRLVEMTWRISTVLFQRIAASQHLPQTDASAKFNDHLFTVPQERLVMPSYGLSPNAVSFPVYALKRQKNAPKAPKLTHVFNFAFKIAHSTRLSPECLVIALVYLERLLTTIQKTNHKKRSKKKNNRNNKHITMQQTHDQEEDSPWFVAPEEKETSGSGFDPTLQIHLHRNNWRSIVLGCFLLASKMWEDVAPWTVAFAAALPDYHVKGINRLERILCSHLDFKLHVEGATYARYYFCLLALGPCPLVCLPLGNSNNYNQNTVYINYNNQNHTLGHHHHTEYPKNDQQYPNNNNNSGNMVVVNWQALHAKILYETTTAAASDNNNNNKRQQAAEIEENDDNNETEIEEVDCQQDAVFPPKVTASPSSSRCSDTASSNATSMYSVSRQDSTLDSDNDVVVIKRRPCPISKLAPPLVDDETDTQKPQAEKELGPRLVASASSSATTSATTTDGYPEEGVDKDEALAADAAILSPSSSGHVPHQLRGNFRAKYVMKFLSWRTAGGAGEDALSLPTKETNTTPPPPLRSTLHHASSTDELCNFGSYGGYGGRKVFKTHHRDHNDLPPDRMSSSIFPDEEGDKEIKSSLCNVNFVLSKVGIASVNDDTTKNTNFNNNNTHRRKLLLPIGFGYEGSGAPAATFEEEEEDEDLDRPQQPYDYNNNNMVVETTPTTMTTTHSLALLGGDGMRRIGDHQYYHEKSNTYYIDDYHYIGRKSYASFSSCSTSGPSAQLIAATASAFGVPCNAINNSVTTAASGDV